MTVYYLSQRIATQTRNGGPAKLKLECFVEALSDPASGLTYAALTGTHKQSVIDAERLFSPELVSFIHKNDYHYEAQYLETVLNWRRACDERGINELTRCKYNYQFLNLLLSELMPWHVHTYDFSLLEVNRLV